MPVHFARAVSTTLSPSSSKKARRSVTDSQGGTLSSSSSSSYVCNPSVAVVKWAVRPPARKRSLFHCFMRRILVRSHLLHDPRGLHYVSTEDEMRALRRMLQAEKIPDAFRVSLMQLPLIHLIASWNAAENCGPLSQLTRVYLRRSLRCNVVDEQ